MNKRNDLITNKGIAEDISFNLEIIFFMLKLIKSVFGKNVSEEIVGILRQARPKRARLVA